MKIKLVGGKYKWLWLAVSKKTKFLCKKVFNKKKNCKQQLDI